MSYAERQARIGRYQEFYAALDRAASRAVVRSDTLFYKKYAARMAGMIQDIEVHHRHIPAGA